MADKRLMVLGNAGVSLTCTSEGNAVAGQIQTIHTPYELEPIGSGLLTAIAAAKLGADVVLATCLGKDLFGSYVLDILSKNKIDTRAVKLDQGYATSLTTSFKQPSGKITSLYYAGANSGITAADAESAFLSYPDALLLHFDCNEYTVKTAVDYAAKQSIPVFCEPSPVLSPVSLGAIHSPTILTPDEEQSLALTGIHPDSVDSALAAADKLYRQTSAKYVIIRMGRRGTFIYDGKYHDMVSASDLHQIDSRGQADGFLAALSLFYVTTQDITRSVRFANTVSGIIGAEKGGYTALPDLETVTAIMKKNQIIL